MLYLTCTTDLPKTGSTVDWKLDGTAKASYKLSSATLKVMPVDKSAAVKDWKFKMAKTKTGNNAGATSVSL